MTHPLPLRRPARTTAHHEIVWETGGGLIQQRTSKPSNRTRKPPVDMPPIHAATLVPAVPPALPRQRAEVRNVDARRRWTPKPKKTKAEKAADEENHLELVLDAAKTAMQILQKHGFPATLFGSLACKLYGNSRCPKDADILVFPPEGDTETDAEALKRIIVAAAPDLFYLKDARDPSAPYRILWFKHPPLRGESKVDILVPGSMSMPRIRPSRIRLIRDLSVAPFSFILLHKLKGWSDHRAAPEGFKRARQTTDAGDVRRLLDLKKEMVVLQKSVKAGIEPPWWRDSELFDEQLQTDSVVRVQEFAAEFPARIDRLRSLGFEVADPPQRDDIHLDLDLKRINLAGGDTVTIEANAAKTL